MLNATLVGETEKLNKVSFRLALDMVLWVVLAPSGEIIWFSVGRSVIRYGAINLVETLGLFDPFVSELMSLLIA